MKKEWHFFAPYASWYLMLAAIVVMWILFGGTGGALGAAAGIGFGCWILFQILANAAVNGAAQVEYEKSKDWHKSIQMIKKMDKNIELEYEIHYMITEKNVRELDWLPAYLREYMAREMELKKELHTGDYYNNRFVTNAAYTYSRCYAWQKMIDDETCMPQGLMDRVNAQRGENQFHFRLHDLIWQEWNQLGYENYARQYEQTGVFRAPWLRERTGMPEWYYEKHPDERPANV